ncbi:hypothetical protein M1D72_00990 [Vibrio sp. AK197]
MQHNEFVALVKRLLEEQNLPSALAVLKNSEDTEVASAAHSLTGQFSLAEIEGERRIYHISIEKDDQGVEQEYVEHVMNEGDDLIRFVAWFFDSQFDIKRKETYQVAGKTYRQEKRA